MLLYTVSHTAPMTLLIAPFFSFFTDIGSLGCLAILVDNFQCIPLCNSIVPPVDWSLRFNRFSETCGIAILSLYRLRHPVLQLNHIE